MNHGGGKHREKVQNICLVRLEHSAHVLMWDSVILNIVMLNIVRRRVSVYYVWVNYMKPGVCSNYSVYTDSPWTDGVHGRTVSMDRQCLWT